MLEMEGVDCVAGRIRSFIPDDESSVQESKGKRKRYRISIEDLVN
jgi:hypothetical protein